MSNATTVPGRMEISLRNTAQLFNTMDPAPFDERDLDLHAEQFLVSWAQEFPHTASLELVVHLREETATPQAAERVRAGLQHYFAERERLKRVELMQLLRQGRSALLVGVTFLALCLSLGSLLKGSAPGSLAHLAYESLTIAGWVAMWRPLQIHLYDWWPLRQQISLYRRLQRMPVSLRNATETVPEPVAGR